MRILWLTGGLIALGLGLLGIPLPLVPTVPFLLLSAFCFARSSERLHLWLTTHPRLGPPIHAWAENGAIARRAKLAATGAMAASFALTLAFGLGPTVLLLHVMTLCCVGAFIWSRPEA